MPTVFHFEEMFGVLFENSKDLLILRNLELVWERINAYQLMIDFLLLLFALYIVFRKPVKPEKPLSDKEIRQLLEEWEPEPFVPPRKNVELMSLNDKVPVITRSSSLYAEIDGKMLLNLAKADFLGMIGNPRVEEAAIQAVHKYGTGTCGPRGFAGTIDIHLHLEERIARFMQSEDTVIYSYGFVTISSTIPAFSGRGDLLLVDKGVNFSIVTGVKLSRSDVLWFNHNDMGDLERILRQVKQEDHRTKRKINRRWIIIEGVYYNYGDMVPLEKVIQLKNEYRWRLIMDDSCGIGIIGKTGRGTCEYFNVPTSTIDILTADLAMVAGSVGGFCCSSKSITYHQRLNSSGYVYSASMPPLLAASAMVCFDIIDEKPEQLTLLAQNISYMQKGLSSIDGMTVTSVSYSPVIHFRLRNPPKDRLKTEIILQAIVDEAFVKGVLLTRAKYVYESELFLPPPSIRICVSVAHTKRLLDQALEVIEQSVKRVFDMEYAESSFSPRNEEEQTTKRRAIHSSGNFPE